MSKGGKIIKQLLAKRNPQKAIAKLTNRKLKKAAAFARSAVAETGAEKRVHGLCMLEAVDRFIGWKGGVK